MSGCNHYVTVHAVVVVCRTDRAALVELEEGEEEWFPFSQCEGLEELAEGEDGEFLVPDWLLRSKSLEYYIE